VDKFELQSLFSPTGDQPQAIDKLLENIQKGIKHQVLLGVTGSGKTFTMANIINRLNWPTLVISHNKTLAGQLYQEYRAFLPKNATEYFVSYYDYYQPEAYIPQTDTYIEKETQINDEIDKLRLSTTTSLMTRNDVATVASVSCIYNIGSPKEYGGQIIELRNGMKLRREDLFNRLIQLQYKRADYDFKRSTFRVKGDTVDVFLAYQDLVLRLEFLTDKLQQITALEPMSLKTKEKLPIFSIYPAKHYLTASHTFKNAIINIKRDLASRLKELKAQKKEMEAYRLEQKTNYDLEMMEEMGYCNGIENYSRYFDGRKEGEPPFTLLDYFGRTDLPKGPSLIKDGPFKTFKNHWLLIIDESHITIPQIRGMYQGDKSRKQTLIDYGFRLPSALDNRPLRFEEFLQRLDFVIYTSATPSVWELNKSYQAAQAVKLAGSNGLVEQLIRPTGILDPQIEIRASKGQIDNLILEIKKRAAKHERVLVTTLTKRMSEDLTDYLKDQDIKVQYLHSDVETLERSDILEDLRLGNFDVLIGINLLREGLDLPEVSLVCILDADKEGFLRSEVSLIQTMGRAARHINGKVIMYADIITGSMRKAIDEVNRRRKIQAEYNQKNQIIPQSITKPVRERLYEKEAKPSDAAKYPAEEEIILEAKTKPSSKEKVIKLLEEQMKDAAKMLDFEKAAYLRDKIIELKKK